MASARITRLRAWFGEEMRRLGGRDRRLLRDDRALPAPRPAPTDEVAPLAPPPRLAAPAPLPAVVPAPRALRRERRALARRLEDLQRDLGGLAMEMATQNHFNYALLRGRAVEAAEIDRRLREVEALIAAERAGRAVVASPMTKSPPPAPEAVAPAPVALPLEAPAPPPPPVPVAVCGRCGADRPADANFCAYCGALQGDQGAA